MKFKKIISAVLVFCLAASSVLSAAAYTVDENAFVDVNGNKRIDVGDALQTLQYSVGKFRKFSAQEKKCFMKGASVTPAMELIVTTMMKMFGSET